MILIEQKKQKPSFTKNYLQNHRGHKNSKIEIASARELDKLRNTFIEYHLKLCQHKGRIHADINQLRSDQGGTVTGRFPIITIQTYNRYQHGTRNLGMGIRSLYLYLRKVINGVVLTTHNKSLDWLYTMQL